MKTKKPYLPLNIRQGMSAKKAAIVALESWSHVENFSVAVNCYSHGRDLYGNGTSHYTCFLVSGRPEDNGNYICEIVSTGARREQVGYSGQHAGALYALEKLGYELDLSNAGSYDSDGSACYPLLNFPFKN